MTAENKVTVHCYELVKPKSWLQEVWWMVRKRPRPAEHRVLVMTKEEFAATSATFEVMVRISMCDVQVEHACGCVFDVGTKPATGRLCDQHWFDWVLEQSRTAKVWKGITWNNRVEVINNKKVGGT